MGGSTRYGRRAAGFTLIEVVVVLMIFSLVIAMAAAITRSLSAAQKRSLTITRLALVDAALVQFVSQTKRLPCPADGTLLSTANTAGVEVRNANGGCSVNVATPVTLQNGVVPWRTLGLTESDATDGWERRLTYRLQPELAANGSPMDMSSCDPASSLAIVATATCNPACSSTALASCTPPASFLLNKGLTVKNIAGTTVMDPTAVPPPTPPTGAAYVVISHGETGGGGFASTGTLTTSSVTDGTEEARNYANLTFVAGTTFYVDDSLMEASGPTHFDDLVSRPTLLSVITKAGLGPRSH